MRRNNYHKEKRKPKTKQKNEKLADRPTSKHHFLYGEIPLIYENGWPRYDPDFRPKLPPNAIRGDVSKQDFCTAHYTPKYFYLDESKQCQDCGCDFIFSAQEQKFWYEERKFNFNSSPVHCLDCRKKRRSKNRLRDQMTTTSEAILTNPDDPQTLIAYAKTAYNYHNYFAQGNLEKAIAAARKAYKLSPDLSEALFWNAVCLEAAQHFAKAQTIYRQFLNVAAHNPNLAALLENAKHHLTALEAIPTINNKTYVSSQ